MNADPAQVLAALDGATGREEALAATVYRASGHAHREAGPRVRRQLLALDAARYGERELAKHLTEVTVPQQAADPWVVRWATGTGLDARLRYAFPAPATVGAVATVVTESGGLAVAGCADGTLHWWDLATGGKRGEAATGHSGEVGDLATAVLDGRPVAVTGGLDGTVRVWDLTGAAHVGTYRADGDTRVITLTTALVEGRPVVVGGGSDGVVRVWELTAGTDGGEPLTVPTGRMRTLATAVLDGRPALLTGHSQGTVRVWDLLTGQESMALGDHAGDGGEPTGGCASLEISAATHLLATDPTSASTTALSATSYEVTLWNLATGERSGGHIPVGFAETASLQILDGRPAALVASAGHGRVELWDLSTRTHLGLPLTGHSQTVRGTATASLKGRHLAVTGGDDRSVRVWDLDGGQEAAGQRVGHAASVQEVTTAVVDGRSVVISAAADRTVRIWDLDEGRQLGEPLTGHTNAVSLLTVGTVDGRPTLLARDRVERALLWDLATREPLPGPPSTEYTSSYISLYAAPRGRFAGVTWEGRVWDLTTSRWVGVRPRHGGILALETLEDRDVIMTGRMKQTVHLSDLATGEAMGQPLTGHTSEVRAGAVGLLDGNMIVATGDGDGAVRVWDAVTGQRTGAYAFPAGIGALAVAPDGRLVVGFGSDIAVLTHRRPFAV
ncbi:MAG TPA: hypothetical protein VGL02_15680 [Streptomyces sp.]